MENKIKWQTGEPKEEGSYLVTIEQIVTHRKEKRKKGKLKVQNIEVAERFVVVKEFHLNYGWLDEYVSIFHKNEDIIAWCKLNDIEPYKE